MLPLSGIRVVAWTAVVAGPYGGLVLADMGAEVIRVERAGPAPPNGWLGAGRVAHNRNKKSIAIDLRSEDGKEIMRKLLKTADIFYENFSPGAASRLGFSYETVSELNPRIVYISLKGYGEGPYRLRPAYDPCIEAETGIMALTGTPGRPPIRISGSVIDETTGLWCAIAAVGALMNRMKTGKGEYIRVGMFESAVSLQSKFIALNSLYKKSLEPKGSGDGAAKCFETINWWIYIGVHTDEDWLRLSSALGVDEREKQEFATSAARNANLEKVEKVVAEVVSKMTSEEVLIKLVNAGVPCAPVNTMANVINDPHAKATKSLVYLTPDPKVARSPVAYTMLPIRDSGYNPNVKGWGGKPTTFRGEHTVEILRGLGYTDDQITDLQRRKIVWPCMEEA